MKKLTILVFLSALCSTTDAFAGCASDGRDRSNVCSGRESVADIASCTTTIPPGLVVNQTWTLAGSPYCVNGDIDVSLLTIEPGVEVLVDGPYGIDVLSTITAIGTKAAPITFSARDPAVLWKGFHFQNTPVGSNFTHCVIEYSDDSGITLVDSAAPVLNSSIIRNNSVVGSGGGINAIRVTTDLELVNCSLFDNTASQHGGALFVEMNDGFSVIVTDSTFEDNTANPSYASGNYVGGALYLKAGDAMISNTVFRHNQSNSRCAGTFGCNVTARGGAVYTAGIGDIEIVNSQFIENQTDARNNGNCFHGGVSHSYGGGIYVGSASVTLTNNTFSCNSTTWTNCGPADGGGGIYVNNGSATVVNSTIARNTNATGVEQAGGTLDVLNSILYFNNEIAGTDPLEFGPQLGGVVTVTYSDVQGSDVVVREGNINFNPVFSGEGCEATDLQIVLGSPAIDAGDPDPMYNDACFPPSLGTVRNDMGAFGGPLGCNWNLLPVAMFDIDANHQTDALTDGLLVIRYAFGFRGQPLVDSAVAPDCTRCTIAEIEAEFAQLMLLNLLDADDNGTVDALTDGLLVIRYLFGFRGVTLIDNAVAPDCNRCSVVEIETYLEAQTN